MRGNKLKKARKIMPDLLFGNKDVMDFHMELVLIDGNGHGAHSIPAGSHRIYEGPALCFNCTPIEAPEVCLST